LGGDVTEDWRKSIVECWSNPDKIKDRKIHRRALKYVLVDGELHRQTVDGILLKCVDREQARVAMGLCRFMQDALVGS
jgi:hypothetical protein